MEYGARYDNINGVLFSEYGGRSIMAPPPDTGQSQFVEAVFTCRGNFYDPNFPQELEAFNRRLHHLLNADDDVLVIKKVEPWNSVKVTVNIPKDAAETLKSLASQNDGAALKSMGIMSLQMEGGRIISLMLANSCSRISQTKSKPAISASGLQTMSNRLPDRAPEGSKEIVADDASSSIAIENLLNSSLTSSSTQKDPPRPPPNMLAPPARRPAKQKAEKRQRKPTSTRTSIVKKSNKSKVSTAPATLINDSSVPSNLKELAKLTAHEHIDKNIKNMSIGEKCNEPYLSKSPPVDQPPASTPVIHPALKDTVHDQSQTTTVSVSGVTDRASVNNLVASLFERSLSAATTSSAPDASISSIPSQPRNVSEQEKETIESPSKTTCKEERLSISSNDLLKEDEKKTVEPPDKPDTTISLLADSYNKEKIIPSGDLCHVPTDGSQKPHDASITQNPIDENQSQITRVPNDSSTDIAHTNMPSSSREPEANQGDFKRKPEETLEGNQGEFKHQPDETLEGNQGDLKHQPDETLESSKGDFKHQPDQTLEANQGEFKHHPDETLEANQGDFKHLPEETLEANQIDSANQPEETLEAHENDSANQPEETLEANQGDFKHLPEETLEANQNDSANQPEETLEAHENDSANQPEEISEALDTNTATVSCKAEPDSALLVTSDTVEVEVDADESVCSSRTPSHIKSVIHQSDNGIKSVTLQALDEDSSVKNERSDVEISSNDVVQVGTEEIRMEHSLDGDTDLQAANSGSHQTNSCGSDLSNTMDEVVLDRVAVSEVTESDDGVVLTTTSDNTIISEDSIHHSTERMEMTDSACGTSLDKMDSYHQPLTERMDSSESQDSVFAKQEVMVPSVTRSPSVSPTSNLNHVDSSSASVDLDGIENSNPVAGPGFIRITSTEFSETLPVIESDIIDVTRTSLSSDQPSINTDEIEGATTADKDGFNTDQSSHDIGSCTALELSRHDILSQTENTAIDGMHVLKPYTQGLYNPAQVPDELPDEILADDGDSQSSLQHDLKFTSSGRSIPVTDSNHLVYSQAMLSNNEEAATADSLLQGEPISVICVTPSNTAESSNVQNQETASSHPSLDQTTSQSSAAIVDEDDERCFDKSVKDTNSSTTNKDLADPSSQQMVNGHEPAENGSSTSTDSGVVPGSPKSDLCTTPPPVDEGLSCVAADIRDDTAEVPAIQFADETVQRSTISLSVSKLEPPKTSVIVQSSGQSVSSNRPRVSILKSINTTNSAAHSVTRLPSADTQLQTSVLHVSNNQKVHQSASKTEHLSMLMNDSPTKLSDVLIAAASAASSKQYPTAHDTQIHSTQPLKRKPNLMISSSSSSSVSSASPTTLLLSNKNEKLVIIESKQKNPQVHKRPKSMADQSTNSGYYSGGDKSITDVRSHIVSAIHASNSSRHSSAIIRLSSSSGEEKTVGISTTLTTQPSSNGPVVVNTLNAEKNPPTPSAIPNIDSVSENGESENVTSAAHAQRKSVIDVPSVTIVGDDNSQNNCDIRENNKSDIKELHCNIPEKILEEDKILETMHPNDKSDEPPNKKIDLDVQTAYKSDCDLHNSTVVNGISEHCERQQKEDLLEGNIESLHTKNVIHETHPYSKLNSNSTQKKGRSVTSRNRSVKSPVSDFTPSVASKGSRKRTARQSEDHGALESKDGQNFTNTVVSTKKANKPGSRTAQSDSMVKSARQEHLYKRMDPLQPDQSVPPDLRELLICKLYQQFTEKGRKLRDNETYLEV